MCTEIDSNIFHDEREPLPCVQTNLLVPKHTLLGDRRSPHISFGQAGRPVPKDTMLVGRCSTHFSYERAGRPVPEHTMLGSRCGP